jgi:UDP-N-acetylglucosamine--N-acetylmuramyl-(pentapeptide) pyrophosphoryl-undecaprenol N-acetylglucosamine transferase
LAVDRNKKILIATGGTGGHIYPAIVTAEELRRRGWEVCFIGTFGPAADKLRAKGFKHFNITAKGFVSKSLWQKFLAGVCLVRAFFSCAGFMVRFQPEAVLGFGGYSSFSAVLVGRMLGVKAMIHEQNVCPGQANKALGRIVRKVAISFKDSAAAFPDGKTVWTGYPMRPMAVARLREQVLRELGLEEDRRTILVFGGSQGSRAINNSVLACLEQVDGSAPWQVIHLAGRAGVDELISRYARLSFPVYVKEYMDNIEDAYAVADIVIARSGAGTVTELGLLGIPAILVPYPYAQSHQEANARVLARDPSAVIIQEKDLNPSVLGDKIFSVLAQPFTREDIRSKLADNFASDAAVRLVDEVERL